jgi:DNA-binding NarL/FixJ family response regulator
MRLVLVDDHALFRDGLRNLLLAHGQEVVGEAANGRDAIALVRNVQPDVVLMDIQMPLMSGYRCHALAVGRVSCAPDRDAHRIQ